MSMKLAKQMKNEIIICDVNTTNSEMKRSDDMIR